MTEEGMAAAARGSDDMAAAKAWANDVERRTLDDPPLPPHPSDWEINLKRVVGPMVYGDNNGNTSQDPRGCCGGVARQPRPPHGTR